MSAGEGEGEVTRTTRVARAASSLDLSWIYKPCAPAESSCSLRRTPPNWASLVLDTLKDTISLAYSIFNCDDVHTIPAHR